MLFHLVTLCHICETYFHLLISLTFRCRWDDLLLPSPHILLWCLCLSGTFKSCLCAVNCIPFVSSFHFPIPPSTLLFYPFVSYDVKYSTLKEWVKNADWQERGRGGISHGSADRCMWITGMCLSPCDTLHTCLSCQQSMLVWLTWAWPTPLWCYRDDNGAASVVAIAATATTLFDQKSLVPKLWLVMHIHAICYAPIQITHVHLYDLWKAPVTVKLYLENFFQLIKIVTSLLQFLWYISGVPLIDTSLYC